MQRNPMPRSSRWKNVVLAKDKTSKASTEATSSNRTAQEPPASLPEEIPVPMPALLQPQPDISQSNPTTQITPSAAVIDDEEPDPEEVIQEFMRRYG